MRGTLKAKQSRKEKEKVSWEHIQILRRKESDWARKNKRNFVIITNIWISWVNIPCGVVSKRRDGKLEPWRRRSEGEVSLKAFVFDFKRFLDWIGCNYFWYSTIGPFERRKVQNCEATVFERRKKEGSGWVGGGPFHKLHGVDYLALNRLFGHFRCMKIKHFYYLDTLGSHELALDEWFKERLTDWRKWPSLKTKKKEMEEKGDQ